EQLRRALGADEVDVRREAEEVRVIVRRDTPLEPTEQLIVDAVEREAAAALRVVELLEENRRQTQVQRGFYRIASLLGEPVSLTEPYDATAQAAAEALGGEFASVYVDGVRGLEPTGDTGSPDSLRGLRLPDAVVQAARDGQLLAAACVETDDRFDERWRAADY